MSGGYCVVQVSDDFVDFGKGDRGVVGGRAMVSFHKIGWEWGSVLCVWGEKGISEDITFPLKVGYSFQRRQGFVVCVGGVEAFPDVLRVCVL
jgi:hypothetical protein